jgi:hypothetical protein
MSPRSVVPNASAVIGSASHRSLAASDTTQGYGFNSNASMKLKEDGFHFKSFG